MRKISNLILILCIMFSITACSTTQNTTSTSTSESASSAKKSDKAVVGLAQGTDYAEVTSKAISNAGGLNGIVKKGNTVVIKPNLCDKNKYIDSPTTTDYRVVAEIAREVQELGASRVIIAEGAFGEEPFTEENLALNKYNTIKGVELLSFNDVPKEDCYYIKADNSLLGEELYVPKVYLDADVVITVPKMKTHDATKVSLGLKNAIGVPPMPLYHADNTIGRMSVFHTKYDINDVIVELNKIRKPDFTVIDAMVAGEGTGPLNNDPVNAQTVFASNDIVAVDTVGATFMGFKPENIDYLVKAGKNGLGEGNIDNIDVVGGKLQDLVIDFKSNFPK